MRLKAVSNDSLIGSKVAQLGKPNGIRERCCTQLSSFHSRRTVFDTQTNNGAAVPAPQPAQTPVAPFAAQATANVQPTATNDITAAIPSQPSVLQPVGIWRSTEARFATSPITHFRRRISQVMSPAPVIPRDDEGPAIHVAAPTAEQATALQSLPWEALTMAQRQREIKTQPSLPSHLVLNPHSATSDSTGSTLRPVGSRNVSWDPSNGMESPWASHTPVTSQAPEVFSQIHATRVQTRSQSRMNGGSGLSRENSVSSAGNGLASDAGEETKTETTSPAQMAAMAALRRANQQRTTLSLKPTARVASSGAGSPMPILQDEIAGAYDYWNVHPETNGSLKGNPKNTRNTQLIPLFVDAVGTQDLRLPAPPHAALSPRSVIASIRWGVDQVRQSRRTGEEEDWRSEVDRLRQAHADLGTAITELATDEAEAGNLQ